MVSTSANRRSHTGNVVVSLVRNDNKQEIKTRNGLLNFFPTNVTDGSGKSRMACLMRLKTMSICLLSIITPLAGYTPFLQAHQGHRANSMKLSRIVPEILSVP